TLVKLRFEVGTTAQPALDGKATQSGGVPSLSTTALKIAVTPAANGSSTRTMKVTLIVPGVPPDCAGTSTIVSHAVPATAPSAQPTQMLGESATKMVFCGTTSLMIVFSATVPPALLTVIV